MKIEAFLNRNFKPLMRWYYKRFKKKEILSVLKLFHDYSPIESYDAVKTLYLQDGWNLRKATTAFWICVYCGFLSTD